MSSSERPAPTGSRPAPFSVETSVSELALRPAPGPVRSTDRSGASRTGSRVGVAGALRISVVEPVGAPVHDEALDHRGAFVWANGAELVWECAEDCPHTHRAVIPERNPQPIDANRRRP